MCFDIDSFFFTIPLSDTQTHRKGAEWEFGASFCVVKLYCNLGPGCHGNWLYELAWGVDCRVGGGGGHHFQKSVCVCKSSSVYNYGERERVYISIKKLQKKEREGERKKMNCCF